MDQRFTGILPDLLLTSFLTCFLGLFLFSDSVNVDAKQVPTLPIVAVNAAYLLDWTRVFWREARARDAAAKLGLVATKAASTVGIAVRLAVTRAPDATPTSGSDAHTTEMTLNPLYVHNPGGC